MVGIATHIQAYAQKCTVQQLHVLLLVSRRMQMHASYDMAASWRLHPWGTSTMKAVLDPS